MKRLLLATTLLVGSLLPARASAWDPSTTHAAMVKRAVVESQMHMRWMDGSGLRRGVFTALRVDPARLDPETRRMLTVAFRRAHAASGAAGLGGPGACPGPSAPVSTQVRCVEGDKWEMTALGWIELGVVLETTPRSRLLHHFADRNDPASPTWADPELPAAVLRVKERRGEGPLARQVNRTAFAGGSVSAVGWLSDESDPWAPPQTFARLHKATFAATPHERDHELALALVGIGALLHVVQDQSVPAHARGDVTAFFAPLSPTPGDRGLPLQEYARLLFGRHALPRAVALQPRQAEGTRPRPVGVPLSGDLHGHLLGAGTFEGLTRIAATRFWSESSIPAPRTIDPELSPEEAAKALVGDGAGLASSELEGAKLQPWPAKSGYLVSSTGRGLAAFEVDDAGVLQLYLDRRIYRDQAAHLIPLGIEVSASVLDLVFAAFPPLAWNRDTGIAEIDLRAGIHDPVLAIVVENADGERRVQQRLKLRAAERNHLRGFAPGEAPEGGRIVLVLTGRTAPSGGGVPIVAERELGPPPEAEPEPPSTAPEAMPKTPSSLRPAQPTPKEATPKTSETPAPTKSPTQPKSPEGAPGVPAEPGRGDLKRPFPDVDARQGDGAKDADEEVVPEDPEPTEPAPKSKTPKRTRTRS